MEGVLLGFKLGARDRSTLGFVDGKVLGTADGVEDGILLGADDGSFDGEGVGRNVGVLLGTSDGMFGGPSQKSHDLGQPSRTNLPFNHLPQYSSVVAGESQSHSTFIMSTSNL